MKTYLSHSIRDYFVQGKSDVCMDSKHLTERIFVRCTFHVAVQNVFHHIQKGWVIILNLYFICKEEDKRSNELEYIGDTIRFKPESGIHRRLFIIITEYKYKIPSKTKNGYSLFGFNRNATAVLSFRCCLYLDSSSARATALSYILVNLSHNI